MPLLQPLTILLNIATAQSLSHLCPEPPLPPLLIPNPEGRVKLLKMELEHGTPLFKVLQELTSLTEPQQGTEVSCPDRGFHSLFSYSSISAASDMSSERPGLPLIQSVHVMVSLPGTLFVHTFLSRHIKHSHSVTFCPQTSEAVAGPDYFISKFQSFVLLSWGPYCGGDETP